MHNEDRKRTVLTIDESHKGILLFILILSVFGLITLVWLTISLNSLRDNFKEAKTEVRILQMHVQDQNAILIRQGIINPGDLTTGPTNQDKVKTNERNSL